MPSARVFANGCVCVHVRNPVVKFEHDSGGFSQLGEGREVN